MSAAYLQAYYDLYMPDDIKSKYTCFEDFKDRELMNFVRQVLDSALLTLFVYNVWTILIL